MDRAAFITHIRSFTNIQDIAAQSDDTVMAWCFMAETDISLSLRIAEMVQIDTATLTGDLRVPFPPDYIAADFVRNTTDDQPLLWKDRYDFYSLAAADRAGFFTQSGSFIEFGDGDTDEIELHYFGDVPHLTTDETWLSSRFNSLLTAGTLAAASMAMEEPDKALTWETKKSDQISTLNNRYIKSIASGSKLYRKMRGFG